MGLFGGGGRLRAQVEQLSAQVEAAQAALEEAQGAARQAQQDATAARAQAQEAEGRAKASRKKLDKANEARSAAEKKAHELTERVSHLEGELVDFRQGMLDARRELERARGRIMELERGRSAPSAAPVVAAPAAGPQGEAAPATPPPAPPAPAADAPSEERGPSRRDLERLEGKVSRLTEERDQLKERLKEAQDKARGADKRVRSESQKSETTLRDLQHNLKSERRAYKILQLQYEALIDRARGAEQRNGARATPGPAPGPVVTAEAPKPLAEVVPEGAE